MEEDNANRKFSFLRLAIISILIQSCKPRVDYISYYAGAAENGSFVSFQIKASRDPKPLESTKSIYDLDVVLEVNGQKQTLSTQLENEMGTKVSAFVDDPKAIKLGGGGAHIYRHNGLGKFGVALNQTLAYGDQSQARKTGVLQKNFVFSEYSDVYNFVSKDKTGVGYGVVKIDVAAKTWAYWVKENASAKTKGHFSGTLVERGLQFRSYCNRNCSHNVI